VPCLCGRLSSAQERELSATACAILCLSCLWNSCCVSCHRLPPPCPHHAFACSFILLPPSPVLLLPTSVLSAVPAAQAGSARARCRLLLLFCTRYRAAWETGGASLPHATTCFFPCCYFCTTFRCAHLFLAQTTHAVFAAAHHCRLRACGWTYCIYALHSLHLPTLTRTACCKRGAFCFFLQHYLRLDTARRHLLRAWRGTKHARLRKTAKQHAPATAAPALTLRRAFTLRFACR